MSKRQGPLRIAAFGFGFVAFGHTVLGMMLAEPRGPAETVVLEASPPSAST